MTTAIPSTDIDMFSPESVRNAQAVDDAIRELAPVVRTEENVVMLGRYEDVAKGLVDFKSFSNTGRPWFERTAGGQRGNLLMEDPPEHSVSRAVIARVLSPKALKRLEPYFQSEAAALVGRVRERGGETLDAAGDITLPFVHKVLPDVLGIMPEGRENISPMGSAAWAGLGPKNELYKQALEAAAGCYAWVDKACRRENIAQGSLGWDLYAAADRGETTEQGARGLVGAVLAAGADTTVITMANTIRAFAEFPDQYQLLRENPSLVRNAFDEALRWDSPSRMAGRIAQMDIPIADYVIPEGTQVGLLFAAANRDPRKWQDPERFDIKRDLKGHVGWGYGPHLCAGKALAQLEVDALFGELVRQVDHFELAGEPEPWMTTIGHGPIKLPVRVIWA